MLSGPVKWVQRYTERLFYTHGLFCASHPCPAILFVIFSFLLICYPLSRLPFPETVSQTHTLSYDDVAALLNSDGIEQNDQLKFDAWIKAPPRAFVQQIAFGVVDSASHSATAHAASFTDDDVIKGSLSPAFEIADFIRRFEWRSNDDHENRTASATLDDLCLQVGSANAPDGLGESARHEGRGGSGSGSGSSGDGGGGSSRPGDKRFTAVLVEQLPRYGCLVLSPTAFWSHDEDRLRGDAHAAETLLRHFVIRPQRRPDGAAARILADLMLGFSGAKPLLNRLYWASWPRQRPLPFAVTIVFKQLNLGFVAALRRQLEKRYSPSETLVKMTSSLSSTSANAPGSPGSIFHESSYVPRTRSHTTDPVDQFVLTSYTTIVWFHDLLPLAAAILIYFFCVYFFVNKIELVKSKAGLALAAVAMVSACLIMSFSICMMFGLRVVISGWSLSPYLLIALGLENITVLTRSVVMTPFHLEVKYRVARGLARESNKLMFYLLLEVSLFSAGLLTFVPAIQEFCVFVLVMVVTDFYLQLLFFVTVLSIDIRRLEPRKLPEVIGTKQQSDVVIFKLSDLHRSSVLKQVMQTAQQATAAAASAAGDGKKTANADDVGEQQWQPVFHCPVMTRLSSFDRFGDDTVTSGHRRTPSQQQRIGPVVAENSLRPKDEMRVVKRSRRLRLLCFFAEHRLLQKCIAAGFIAWLFLTAVIVLQTGLVEQFLNAVQLQQHQQLMQEHLVDQHQASMWQIMSKKVFGHWTNPPLSPLHWTTLFDFYNQSLVDGNVVFLPLIKILLPSPANVNSASEHSYTPFGSPTSSAGSSSNSQDANTVHYAHWTVSLWLFIDQITYWEWVFIVLLGLFALTCIFYTLVIMYRIMCSRNYDKWRASWRFSQAASRAQMYGTEVPTEGVQSAIKGHSVREAAIVTYEAHAATDLDQVSVRGTTVAATSLDGRCFVWDRHTGELRFQMRAARVRTPSQLRPRSHSLTAASLPPPPGSDAASRCSATPPPSSLAASIPSIPTVPPITPITPILSSSRSHLSDTADRQLPSSAASLVSCSNVVDYCQQNSAPFSRANSSSIEQLPHSADDNHSDDSSSPSGSCMRVWTCLVTPLGIALGFADGRVEIRSVLDGRLLADWHCHLSASHHNDHSATSSLNCRIADDDGSVPENNARGSDSGNLSEEASQRCCTSATSTSTSLREAGWQSSTVRASGGPVNISSGCHGSDCGVTHLLYAETRRLLCVARLSGFTELLELRGGVAASSRCVLINRAQRAQPLSHMAEHGDGLLVPSSPLLRSASPSPSPSLSPLLQPLASSSLTSTASLSPPAHRRSLPAHQRQASLTSTDEFTLQLVGSCRLHRVALTCAQLAGADRLVTGGLDQCVKVTELDDFQACKYTLYGHEGAIVSLRTESRSPWTAASGCEAGIVCLWDLSTGVCLQRFLSGASVLSVALGVGHVAALTCEHQLLVWERPAGGLTQSFRLTDGHANCVAMFTGSVLLTGGLGCVLLWDLVDGELSRLVPLDDAANVCPVTDLVALDGLAVALVVGSQVRIIQFTSLPDKND